jgi:hypothetical protein
MDCLVFRTIISGLTPLLFLLVAARGPAEIGGAPRFGVDDARCECYNSVC